MAAGVREDLPRYFRIDTEKYNALVITRDDDKQESALWLLDSIHRKLVEGQKIIVVTRESLGDIAATVLTNYQERIGILMRIWECILRCLGCETDSDRLGQLAADIQNFPIAANAYPVTYISSKMQRVVDFLFASLPTQEALPPYRGSGNKPLDVTQMTINQLFELAEQLLPYVNKLDATSTYKIRQEICAVFIAQVVSVAEAQDLPQAAKILSRLPYRFSQYEEHAPAVSQIVDRCLQEGDLVNAALATGALYDDDLRIKVRDRMLKKQKISDEEFQSLIAMNEKSTYQGNFLHSTIAMRFLKEGNFQRALEIASSIKDPSERSKCLEAIGSRCFSLKNYEQALAAAGKMHGSAPYPLFADIAQGYFRLGKYQEAIGAARGIFDWQMMNTLLLKFATEHYNKSRLQEAAVALANCTSLDSSYAKCKELSQEICGVCIKQASAAQDPSQNYEIALRCIPSNTYAHEIYQGALKANLLEIALKAINYMPALERITPLKTLIAAGKQAGNNFLVKKAEEALLLAVY